MANSNREPIISGTLENWMVREMDLRYITSIMVFIVIALFWNKMKLSMSHIP
jgi:hypothetical protein